MNNEKLQIDYGAGLENPEKAVEVVKQIQSAIDGLVLANNEYKTALDAANSLAENAIEENKHLLQALIGVSDTIKNIHLQLNVHAELVDQAPDIAALRIELAKFVISAGMIKIGAMSYKQKEGNNA